MPRYRLSPPLSRAASAWVLAWTLACALIDPAQSAQPLRIGVAANFRGAAEDIAVLYEQRFGQAVQISSASTGILAAQLRSGAPFDILLAADQQRPRILADDGLAAGGTRCYARGSLVLLGASSIDAAIDEGARIAIANPRSAPYGAAALEALEAAAGGGLPASRLVLGNNVLQALQFFHSGAAKAAIVARSLSPASGVALPDKHHTPIEQHLVINARSTQVAAAERFTAFLLDDEVTPLLTARGYRRCS